MSDKKMCIKLKDDAYDLACNIPYTSEEFRKLMLSYSGSWVDVDTEILFRDQFNALFKGKVVRIPSVYVDAVRNDKRIGKKLCLNCGKSSVYKDAVGRIYNTCPHCKGDYQFYVYKKDSITNGVVL